MNCILESGTFRMDGRDLAPEEILESRKFECIVSGELTEVSVAKRPPKLQFTYDIDRTLSFEVSLRGEILNRDQIRSICLHGYFLDKSRKIYFLPEMLRESVVKAFSNKSVPALLSLLRCLNSAGLLLEVPENLVEKLLASEERAEALESEFVRALYPYQQAGVSWLSFCTRHGLGTILADDMGLGKTAQVIALICDQLAREPDSRFLVVVPNPLIDNWKREFAFFAPGIVPFVHHGKQRHGLASGLAGYKVVITPYTTMASDITLFEDLEFRLVLFDEASMLKNPASSRYKAARRIVSEVKIAMSGTPVENSLMDAWALGDLVFSGYLQSMEEFRSRYVSPDIRETLELDLRDLEKSLHQIILRRMKKDVLDELPAKQDIHLAITAGDKERQGYDSLISEVRSEVDSGGGGILALINRLQQYAAHPVLLDTAGKTDYKSLCDSSAKFQFLMMQLEKICDSGEKVLIFATFRKMIDLIKIAVEERFPVKVGVIDGRTENSLRQPEIDRFSLSENFEVLLLHPKTAGMGFNITAATNVIHYSRQWNPALEEQATARAWRNGQKDIVKVFYLYYADTIEETIDERLRLKQELSELVVSTTHDKESDKQIMINYLESMK